MMAAYPLVGVVMGALVYAWVRLSGWLELPQVLRALGLTLIPIAFTGGIHLDGLADTCDALASNTAPEKRREILKDPNAGAFAVIGVAVYLAAYFGLAFAFDWSVQSVVLLCTGYTLTRTFSGIAVISLPPASDGTVRMFSGAAAKRSAVILAFFYMLCIAVAAICLPAAAAGTSIAWFVVPLCCFAYLRRTAKHKFEGMSGDLAGWFLQLCEIWQLAVIVLGGHIANRFGG